MTLSIHGMTKVVGMALLAVALITCGSYSSAETIQTAFTGQKNCYSSLGSQIKCEGTGQDGQFQAGAQWPNPRFTIGFTGCTITDNLTGLMWARSGKLQCSDTWLTAMTYPNGLTWCAHNDWRAANVNELESLVNAGVVDIRSWLGSFGFNSMQPVYYFSSTSYINNDSNNPSPWSMLLQDGTGTGGSTQSGFLPLKSDTTCIWLVRAGYDDKSPGRVPQTGQTKCYNEFNAEMSCTGTGQDGQYQTGAAWSVTRFNDNGDGTITDQFTNLMWLKDTQTDGPASPAPYDLCTSSTDSGAGVKKTWQDALDYVKYCLNSADQAFLGYRDWRLPNKNELASLLDRSQSGPALPTGNPFTFASPLDGSEGRWTSTTFLRNRSSAWAIHMYYGDVLSNPKAGLQTLHVWPVRGGYPMLIAAVAAAEGSTAGFGGGTVKKNPSGAGCSSYCDPNLCKLTPPDEWPDGAERYNQGKKVTLTAKADKVSAFVGWSGYDPCNGKKGSCTVTVTDDISVTALFASYPTASVSPAKAKNFGNVKTAKTASVNFTVRNNTTNGKQDLTISSIGLSGATDFSIPADKNKCALPPVSNVLKSGKSCSFKVAFTPSTAGARTALLTIESDDPDPDRSTLTVTLTGQGT